MDTKKFYELQNNLKNQNIIFCYSGYVSERILAAIGETLKIKLAIEETELSKTKKVFSIFVEGVQNVIRYSAEILGEENISIASVIQKENVNLDDNYADLVFMTYKCTQSSVNKALEKISKLSIVETLKSMIRVE